MRTFFCIHFFTILLIMLSKSESIRPFLGAKDYNISKSFYNNLGFEETYVSPTMNLYKVNDRLGFYLQDYYSREWIENTMVFLEVDNIDISYDYINRMDLTKKYSNVKLSNIVTENWGQEFFLHDPSGILWHLGVFNK